MPIKDPEKKREAQRRADAKRRARSRGWACIVYPESAPDGWLDALADAHIQTLVSPLHDADVTADGTPKKPHYHCLAMFENPVPEKVHADDHDKHRYDDHDVIELGGASWAAVALDESEERDRILTEVEDWLDEQGVVSYRTLCRYARTHRPDWLHVVRTSTVHLMAYVKSAAWEDSQR